MSESAQLPDVLRLEHIGDHTYRAPFEPADSTTRRVVFGGQILAQMIIASSLERDGGKTVKSLHAVFARPGGFHEALVYEVDAVHDGRTFGSDTVTCRQSDKIVARGLLLATADDSDFIRHTRVSMPDIPVPNDDEGVEDGRVFPGAVVVPRATPQPDAVHHVWTRYPAGTDDDPVAQAVLSWASDGYLIGAALLPHAEYDEGMAHRTIDTAVVSHTINFHDRFDASEWLLLSNESVWAGRGRSYGRCDVFTSDGRLVANYTQDSMVRAFPGAGTTSAVAPVAR